MRFRIAQIHKIRVPFHIHTYVCIYMGHYYAFRKQMSIWRERDVRRVEDIIISQCGKGVKSTVKQAYASRRDPLCATRGTVVNSLSRCPLKSLARQDDRIVGPATQHGPVSALRVPLRERPERSLPPSPRITSRRAEIAMFNETTIIVPSFR